MIIKMPETVPPAVTRSFAALIPGFIVVTVVWIIRLIFEHTTFGSIHNVVGSCYKSHLVYLVLVFGAL